MINVKQLTKNYGDRCAVKNLNFTVKSGEVVGFLGPNGAGKTTTMKIITGFMAASSGQVCIDGDDVYEHPLKVKSKIGYLPETPPVYNDMYVKDYLSFVAKLKGLSKNIIGGNIDYALEQTQLQDVKGRLIKNLSKGFKQRVGIAGALVSKPPILILDEPTVGLDPRQVAEIRKLIIRLRGKHTILLSTHILSEVQAICERVIIINKGEIIAEDSLAVIAKKASVASKFEVDILRKEDELQKTLLNTPGVLEVERNGQKFYIQINPEQLSTESLTKAIVNSGAGLTQFKPSMNYLEKIFINLTTSSDHKEL